MLKSQTHDKADAFLERRRVIQFGYTLFSQLKFLFLLRTQLPPHDLSAFWYAQLPSRYVTSILSRATFQKTSVAGETWLTPTDFSSKAHEL